MEDVTREEGYHHDPRVITTTLHWHVFQDSSLGNCVMTSSIETRLTKT
jgi:hypothetical protein